VHAQQCKQKEKKFESSLARQVFLYGSGEYLLFDLVFMFDFDFVFILLFTLYFPIFLTLFVLLLPLFVYYFLS
jgi:hypothetical protein